jgi:hypothetical protein
MPMVLQCAPIEPKQTTIIMGNAYNSADDIIHLSIPHFDDKARRHWTYGDKTASCIEYNLALSLQLEISSISVHKR